MPVGVDLDDNGAVPRDCRFHSSEERGAHTLVDGVRNDGHAGIAAPRLNEPAGPIRTTIIDNKDGLDLRANAIDHADNRGGRLVGRDYDRVYQLRVPIPKFPNPRCTF